MRFGFLSHGAVLFIEQAMVSLRFHRHLQLSTDEDLHFRQREYSSAFFFFCYLFIFFFFQACLYFQACKFMYTLRDYLVMHEINAKLKWIDVNIDQLI